MLLALSRQISEIDKYCAETLCIPLCELMERSGRAVEKCLRERVFAGSSVVILAGGGNNGGDGYALATHIMSDYKTTVFDCFSRGQRTEEGRYFLEKYRENGGRVENLTLSAEDIDLISRADCIVDALFGTGYSGELPLIAKELAKCVNKIGGAVKIAIDVPLGVNADNGSLYSDCALRADATVALCLPKPGLLSYPAREFAGEIVYDGLGIPYDKLASRFSFDYNLIDRDLARSLLPRREKNSNKGSFGKLLVITGSDKYRGAAHLSLESALRGGVGLVDFLGTESLCRELLMKYPEAIYHMYPPVESLADTDIHSISELSARHSATLIGSGSGLSEGLYRLVKRLLLTDGGPLILDADALNSLACHREELKGLLQDSHRELILTPHPLEFARLYGTDVSYVQAHRIEAALAFAREYAVTLVLKGAATVVTDGKTVYINSSGSSALAKAGSGDVLAGLIASTVASGAMPARGAAASVYYHGIAADYLAGELSELGVIPSDLPCEIARQIAHSKK